MNHFLIFYDNDLKNKSKKKNQDILHYLKFWFSFSNFYFRKNFIFLISIIIILGLMPGNLINNIITFFITGLTAYLFHRLAHSSKFYGKISGHDIHHSNKNSLLMDILEFFSDIFASGGLLLLINIILNIKCIKFFNNYAILLFMIGFPLIHFFNYHYFIEKSYHYYHHKHPMKNFSPDYYDHLFDTNLGYFIEDNSHMIPIFVIVSIILIIMAKNKVLEKFFTSLRKYFKIKCNFIS